MFPLEQANNLHSPHYLRIFETENQHSPATWHLSKGIFHTPKDFQTPATLSLDYQPPKVLILPVLGVPPHPVAHLQDQALTAQHLASFWIPSGPARWHSEGKSEGSSRALGSEPRGKLIYPGPPFQDHRALYSGLFLLPTVCQTLLAGLKKQLNEMVPSDLGKLQVARV